MSTHTPGRLTVTHNSWETSAIYCEGKEVARANARYDAVRKAQKRQRKTGSPA